MDHELLQNVSRNYFQDLYQQEEEGDTWNLCNNFPRIDDDLLMNVQKAFEDKEIKEVMFSMGQLKALGPDGLHLILFHANWSTVGESVVAIVLKCYDDPSAIEDINSMSLVLIPKWSYSYEPVSSYKSL